MSDRRSLAALLALAFLAAGTWYWLSPSYAMAQLRDAAVEGDVEELRERVDFPSVREGLKADFSALMAAELGDDANSGADQFGAMLGMAFIGPVIDNLITPEMIGKMVRSGELKLDRNGGAGPVEDFERSDRSWEIERDGFSRFRAYPADQEDSGEGGLIFERDGLGWKLIGLKIPEDAEGGTN